MKIGYACKTIGVKDTQIKRCVLKNATYQRLHALIKYNLKALTNMITYNIQNNILLFRISSDIIPFASHPVNQIQWWDEYRAALSDIGKMIRTSGMRVSMHPGQYTVLNSPSENIVRRAISEVLYHARFLDTLGLDASHKIVTHIGGRYGDVRAAEERFEKTILRLPQTARSRIVIENDETCFNIGDVLAIGRRLVLPVVFDVLHHRINPVGKSVREIVQECAQTWHEVDGRPKVHYSQQRTAAKAGMHSPTIIIDDFIAFYNQITGVDVDIMLEVKDKNLSAIKCIYCTDAHLKITALEQEWTRYKYNILEKAPTIYQDIRTLLRDKAQPHPMAFYKHIEDALQNRSSDFGKEKNAALHVWGYFSEIASELEKKRFIALLDGPSSNIGAVKRYLHKLAEKYQISYLLNSYYFDTLPA